MRGKSGTVSTLLVEDKPITGPTAGPLPLPTPVHLLTAWNPSGNYRRPGANHEADARLEHRLRQLSIRHVRARGISVDGRWVEDGWATGALADPQALEIANLFRQEAVLRVEEHDITLLAVPDGSVVDSRPRLGAQ